MRAFLILNVLVCFSVLPSKLLVSQEDDPFSPATVSQERFARVNQANDDTASLKQLQFELQESKLLREELANKINAMEAQAETTRARSQYSDKAYSDFLAQLLASKDSAVQLTALQNIKDTRNQAASEGVVYAPASFEIWEQLDKLLDSENEEVSAQAVNTMLTIFPARALERGFQAMPSGFWRPLTDASEEVNRIQSALMHECSIDYDDAPLIEFVEDIQRQYGINFQVDESFDQNKPLTLDVTRISLASALDILAKKLGLVVAIVDDCLWLLPPDNPDIRSTSTYNVRGLLSDKITLEKLAELASGQIDKQESKIHQIGKYQLVAKATLTEQHEISKLLGSLSSRE